ncbi:MAG: permease [Firmicutes bacterium]|nr:permease [Bacillota bacterium]
MFAGHFGVAAAARGKVPEVPLWALVISVQLLDIVFVPLLLLGVESIEPINGGGYGRNVIHAPYTHSLAGAVLISVAVALVAWRRWGRRGGFALGTLTLSHWLLDLIVHRGDMAVMFGPSGQVRLGLGLWENAFASATLEASVITAGFLMYRRFILTNLPRNRRNWGLAATAAMAVCLILALVTDVLGIS